MFSEVTASKAQRAVFATSLRTARESRSMGREAVIYELTRLGHPVSLSTLARWEQYGTIKVEDAYWLTQVYGISLNELLLRFPFPDNPSSGGADDPGGRPVATPDSDGPASGGNPGGPTGKTRRPRRTPRAPSPDE